MSGAIWQLSSILKHRSMPTQILLGIGIAAFMLQWGPPLLGTNRPNPALHNIQKLFIGTMGQSDEAERFRLLLENGLSKVGFSITEKADEADGILRGTLVIRVYADDAVARATVALYLKNGEKVWGHNFEPTRGFGTRDTVKRRANDVAKKLRHDWQEAGPQ